MTARASGTTLTVVGPCIPVRGSCNSSGGYSRLGLPGLVVTASTNGPKFITRVYDFASTFAKILT